MKQIELEIALECIMSNGFSTLKELAIEEEARVFEDDLNNDDPVISARQKGRIEGLRWWRNQLRGIIEEELNNNNP